MAILGKTPVKTGRITVVRQISQLLSFISPTLIAIPRWVSGIRKPIRNMCLIKPSSRLISQSMAMFRDSVFRGQGRTNLFLARLEDLGFKLGDLGSILCAHKTTFRNLSPAKALLLVAIPR